MKYLEIYLYFVIKDKNYIIALLCKRKLGFHKPKETHIYIFAYTDVRVLFRARYSKVSNLKKKKITQLDITAIRVPAKSRMLSKEVFSKFTTN